MAIFDEKIEIRERCKGVHCVDLGESFPTRIYLQKSASIQPRTSPSKFEGKFNSLFTSLLSHEPGRREHFAWSSARASTFLGRSWRVPDLPSSWPKEALYFSVCLSDDRRVVQWSWSFVFHLVAPLLMSFEFWVFSSQFTKVICTVQPFF